MKWPRDTLDEEWEELGIVTPRSNESGEEFLSALALKNCYVDRRKPANLKEWLILVKEYGRADVSRAATRLLQSGQHDKIWPRLIAPEIERHHREQLRAESRMSDDDFLRQFE